MKLPVRVLTLMQKLANPFENMLYIGTCVKLLNNHSTGYAFFI